MRHLMRAFISAITLIDKTDSSNPTKRENFWMRTLKTFAPYGLNVVDSIWLGTGISGKKRCIPCWASPGFGFSQVFRAGNLDTI